jgi:hypothetical protein
MAIVKVKNQEYPIAPTMWAQLQFKREKGKTISQLSADDLEDLLYYTYLCVKGACLRAERAFEFSFEEFITHVEGDPSEALLTGTIEENEKKKKAQS